MEKGTVRIDKESNQIIVESEVGILTFDNSGIRYEVKKG